MWSHRLRLALSIWRTSSGCGILTKILFTDVFNLYNRGERLSVHTITKHLRAEYGYLSLYSIVDPTFFRSRNSIIAFIGDRTRIIALLLIRCLLSYLRAWLYHHTRNERFLTPFLRSIQSYDIAVDLGGETFQDQYNLFGMLKHVYTLKLLRLLNVQYTIISHSIIFQHGLWWALSKPLLQHARAITIRNPDSYNFITQNHLPCVMIPDIVFAFNEIKPISHTSPLRIGVNASPFVSAHLGNYVQLVEALTRNGYQVHLIPHVVFDAKRDDRTVLLQIWKKLTRETQRKTKIYLGSDFKVIKQLIDNCHIWIGSRFHSVIYALGRGIPSIIIGYSDKSHHLKHLLKQNVTVIDGDSPTFTIEIMDKLCDITRSYPTCLRKFHNELNGIKAEAMKHIAVLRSLL